MGVAPCRARLPRWAWIATAAAALASPTAGAAQVSDTTPPVVVSVSVSPASVDVTDAGATVDVTATITDDHSGVAPEPQIRFTGGESSYDGVFRNVGGDVWETQLRIPRYAPTGTMTGFYVLLGDNAGNWIYSRSESITSQSFTITGTSDVTGPVLHSISFSPASGDVTDRPLTIGGNATATDNLSGVADLFVEFRSPTGRQEVYANFNRTSGDDFATTFTIPQYAEAGTWRMTRVFLQDNVGNLGSTDGVPPASVTVTGLADTTPPWVVSLAPTFALVDASAGPFSFTVAATITDDLSGVATPETCAAGCGMVSATSVRFQSPSAPRPWAGPSLGGGPGQMEFGDFRPTGGDGYEATVTIPQYGESGEWAMSHAVVSDRVGNTTWVGTAMDDYLQGEDGDDLLLGYGGHDIERGASGGDTLLGGSGSDRLGGGSGLDILRAGVGRDVVVGGDGRDTIYAGAGNDVVFARDRRSERVYCGSGWDRVRADTGDVVRGCERRF